MGETTAAHITTEPLSVSVVLFEETSGHAAQIVHRTAVLILVIAIRVY